jgi:hypothetical protein
MRDEEWTRRSEVGREIKEWKPRDETKRMRDLGCKMRNERRGMSRKIRGKVREARDETKGRRDYRCEMRAEKREIRDQGWKTRKDRQGMRDGNSETRDEIRAMRH